jgi:hypothetical protein
VIAAEMTQPHMMSACIAQRENPRRAMKRCSTMLVAVVFSALPAFAANRFLCLKSCQPRRQ